MKRSAIKCSAYDATHYLWLDRISGTQFLHTVQAFLSSPQAAEACLLDRDNGGYWLWYHLHGFFKHVYGGRHMGLMSAYVRFDDAAYEPLLEINAVHGCRLIDDHDEVLSSWFTFEGMAQMLHTLLSEEPHADLGILYAWLDVDEEI